MENFQKVFFKYAEKLAINCHSCISIPTQLAGIEALKGQDSVNKMIHEFQERRDFLVTELNKIKNVSCVSPVEHFMYFQKLIKIIKNQKIYQTFFLKKSLSQQFQVHHLVLKAKDS